MNLHDKIICPKCGCEYLPAEIFYADELLGKPTNIAKDENGHILSYDGESLNTNQTFICDKCGCEFAVTGEIKFSTKETAVSAVNFSEDFVVNLPTKK